MLVLDTLALSNLSIYHTEYFLLHMTSENNDNHVLVYSIITINLVYVRYLHVIYHTSYNKTIILFQDI